jgi:dipeptide/tripeptide permease
MSSIFSSLLPRPTLLINILIAEAAERFCYYSIRASLIDLFTLELGWSDAGAVSAASFWSAACYISPILGAVLSDSSWGRFLTILRFCGCYITGVCTLSISAATHSVGGTITGLALIALGAGGIKPCVAPFGADQLEADGAGKDRITSFYFGFYWSINFGSSFAYFSVAAIIAALGFHGAYAICAGAMALAICFFLIPFKSYSHVTPSGSAVLSIGRVITAAIRNGGCTTCCRRSPSSLLSSTISNNNDDSDRDSEREPLRATTTTPSIVSPIISSPSSTSMLSISPSWLDAASGSPNITTNDIQEAKALFRLVPVFATLPFFWCVFDSYGSVWQLQARRMNLCFYISNNKSCISALSMGASNALFVLVLVPLTDFVFVPTVRRFIGEPTPLRRMTLGMFLAAVAFAISGFLEIRIVAAAGSGGVSVLWQLPQFAVLTMAEVLVSTTGLEFSFVEAGKGLKSAVLALFFLMTATGDLLNGALYAALGHLPPATLIWIVTILQVIAACIFAAVSSQYITREQLEDKTSVSASVPASALPSSLKNKLNNDDDDGDGDNDSDIRKNPHT